MADTIILVEDQTTGEVTVNDPQPVVVVESSETLEIQQVESQSFQVTLEAGQPIVVEVTGDVGTVARLAASVVQAEANAALSEQNAAQSELNAGLSADAAATSEQNAATSEDNALQSATVANNHRLDAEQSASDSAGSASASQASATQSATSAANSQAFSDASSTSADESAASATASADSAGNAATSATAAAGSASAAGTSEANAASSAGSASTSAATATTQAGIATQARVDSQAARDASQLAQAGAETAESNAAGSATAAAGSATTALGHANDAAAESLLASQYATYPEDQVIPGTTDNSSLHHAAKAAASAASASGQVEFLGSWDAATNGTPPTPSNSARYIIISDGVVDGKNVYTNDFITYSVPDAEWFVTPGSGNVSSVQGQIGAVVLDYGDFAGAQDIKLDNSIQIKGRTGDGLAEIPLVATTVDDKAYFGHVNYRSYLRSSLVPRWKNSTAEHELIHTGGGQTVAGMEFSAAAVLQNNKWLVGEDTSGTGHSIARVDATDSVVFGNLSLPMQLVGAAVPRWNNGSQQRDLIHVGGGQEILGNLKLESLNIGTGRVRIDSGVSITPGNGTTKTWAVIENQNGAENLAFGMRGDDATDRMSFFTDHGSSGTYTERMSIIAQTGNVGINNTAPTQALSVGGTVEATGDLIAGDDVILNVNDTSGLFGRASAGGGGGLFQLVKLDSGNVVQLGNTSLGVRINSAGVPQWHNGTVAKQLIHDSGGQKISVASPTNVGASPSSAHATFYVESGTASIGFGRDANNDPAIFGFGTGTAYNLSLCPTNGTVYVGGSEVVTLANNAAQHYLGALAPETGRALHHEQGVTAYRVSNASLGTGTDTGYYSVLTFGGTAAAGNAQIAAMWAGAKDKMYWRSMRDVTDNWTDWRRVWHSGDMGSGTGLDADKLDGVEGSGYARYISAGTTVGSNYLANGAYIANNGSGTSNIDHIWHDDTDNAWNFVSDGTFKGGANSILRAGGIELWYDSDTPSDAAVSQVLKAGRSSAQHIQLHGGASGNFLSSVSASANTKPFKIGVSVDGGLTHSYIWQFGIDGTTTLPGNITIGENLILSAGTAIRGNDAWLRLNPTGQYANGIYCGSSVVRTDGQFQVGASGGNFLAYSGGCRITNTTGLFVGTATGLNPGNSFGNGSSIALGDYDTGVRQNGDGVLELWGNNQELMQLTTSNIYSYKRHYFNAQFTVNSSDKTLKKNFRGVDMAELRDKLMQIEWLLYDLKDGSQKDLFGVVAQQVKKILPEVVERNPVTKKLAVSYQMLHNYWAAVSAWQEERLQRVEAALGMVA